MRTFAGKVAVVLGASASRGTGWAIAEALAAEGAKVVVGARSFEPLQELARKIDGVAVRCDVTREADVSTAVATALKSFGRLDVAVNAAGHAIMAPVAEATAEQIHAALEANYLANVYVIRRAAEAMSEGGSIIVISSMATTHVMSPLFPYACAKAATDCLVRYSAVEYGARNIRINSILPGPILSDLTWDYLSLPQIRARMEYEIPLKRIGVPADFANAVLWLAGPSYVTGTNIQVNGGHHLGRFPKADELEARVEDSAGTPLYDRAGEG